MTIENLKQIAIKYATTKGSRVPLAPDELCNAVVQYFNEFLKITADINTIQVAVTEEGGNIVFTITGNTLDGKAFTPIVITVDHNDFVTNQEFEEFKTSVTKQLNNKRSVISSPASSYVVYTQANGLESNLPYSELANQTSTNIMARRANGTSDVKKGISGENVANMENIADVEAKIPDVSNFATKDEIPDVSGFATKSELSKKLDISGGTINGNLTVLGDINNEFLKITADINTIQVAVTEEGGNIVFTITGNTLDGKAFTPIVITVDHNDFVTNQEFEEFKTSVTKQLNNKRSVISSPASSYVVYTQANGLESNLPYSELANQTSTNIMARRANGTSDVKKGISGENVANMENIADVEAKIPDVSNFATKDEIPDVSGFATKSELSKKLDISGGTINGNLTVLGDINTGIYKSRGVEVIDLDISNIRFDVGNASYGINILSSNRPTVKIGENTYNIAFKNDIPEYTNVNSVSYDSTNGAIVAYDGANEIHIPLLAGENVTIDASEDNKKIVISAAGGGGTGDVTAAGNNTFTGKNTFTNEITFNTMKSEAGYIQFGNFNYETTEGHDYLYIDNTHINIQKFVGNNQYHEININADLMTYAPPDDNVYYEYSYPRKNGTFALTSDIPDTSSFVTLAGDNTFGGTNTFNNSIYAKNGVVAGDTTNYGANSVTKGSNTYSFPNKSGTFAMTTDIIKNPIYFISFYANAPSEPCHLIGTMMSKNSYGTGQKTNDEFAVMLADNLYTNSNEGLAAYGKLAEKDILCIYSDDGLSIRCLDEANSEVDLPTVMFFVMETEL